VQTSSQLATKQESQKPTSGAIDLDLDLTAKNKRNKTEAKPIPQSKPLVESKAKQDSQPIQESRPIENEKS
jgi:hypothetical protein